MRRRIALAGLLAVVAPVVAPGVPGVASADEEFSDSVQYSHQGQFGLHASSGLGYRLISPYDKEYCGALSSDGANKSVCTGRSPLFLDLGFTFGVSQSVELMLEARLGLERDFGDSAADADGPRQLAFSPGLRLYIRDAGLTKFFSSFQFVIDQTEYGGAVKATDYGVRNTNGLQLDFHRTFGLYFFFGETIAFSRWFRFELDGGIGIQARVP